MAGLSSSAMSTTGLLTGIVLGGCRRCSARGGRRPRRSGAGPADARRCAHREHYPTVTTADGESRLCPRRTFSRSRPARRSRRRAPAWPTTVSCGWALGPGALEQLGEHLGGLGAGHGVLPVDDEERALRRPRRRGPGRRRLRTASAKSSPARTASTRVWSRPTSVAILRSASWSVTSAPCVKWASISASFSSACTGRAGLAQREVQQPVRVHGAAAHRLVEVVLQPYAGRHLRDPGLHLAGALDAAAVLAGQHLLGALRGRGGRRRVELEGAVLHLHVVAVSEVGQRRLEATLADEAPRADHVGPDLDAHGGHNGAPGGFFPVCALRDSHVSRG